MIFKTRERDETLEKPAKKGFFSRLKTSLTKTRTSLSAGLGAIILGKKVIDESILTEIETLLLTCDVGVETTQDLMADLHKRLARNELANPEAVFDSLKEKLYEVLLPCEQPLVITPMQSPFVLLMVGINGSGKTTTMGKLAHRFKQEGYSVLLSAGDTFRAAAIEQLQAFGTRHQVPVVAQQPGADSASVSFDAFQSAKARQINIMMADTAGRLHTQHNLMEELKKVKRVLQKCDANAPQEIMLVLDASIGQNALAQAEEFHKAVQVTGLCITKLDGTAKGGILFAIAKKLKLPIRFISFGEQADDLKPFEAKEFVDALFDTK